MQVLKRDLSFGSFTTFPSRSRQRLSPSAMSCRRGGWLWDWRDRTLSSPRRVLRPVGFIATPSFLSQVTVSTCLLHIAADAANTESLVGAHADAVSKFSMRADVPWIDQSWQCRIGCSHCIFSMNTWMFLSNVVSAASGAAVLFCTGLFICSVSFLTCTVPSLFYA